MVKHGYAIKFYKRLSFVKPNDIGITNPSFDYSVLTNFDGMNVERVEKFDDYFNKTLITDPTFFDKYYARQKLLIYPLPDPTKKHDNDFLLPDASNPIMVLSLLDICSEYSKKKVSEDINELISHKFLNFVDNKQIKHQLFGTLSSHDYIAVFKGCSFDDIFSCIIELRNSVLHEDNKHYAMNSYSIPFVASNYKENSVKHEDVRVSVQMTLHTPQRYTDIKDWLSKNECGKPSFYYTLGKYDVDAHINFQNPNILAQLYSSGGLLNPIDSKILESGARILYEATESLDSSIVMYSPPYSPEENEKKLEALLTTIRSKIKDTPVIVDMLVRLVLRAFQIFGNGYSQRRLEWLSRLLTVFVDSVVKELSKKDYNHFTGGIASLNTLIDNLTFYNRLSFEAPQSNMRFKGERVKAQSCYPFIQK